MGFFKMRPAGNQSVSLDGSSRPAVSSPWRCTSSILLMSMACGGPCLMVARSFAQRSPLHKQRGALTLHPAEPCHSIIVVKSKEVDLTFEGHTTYTCTRTQGECVIFKIHPVVRACRQIANDILCMSPDAGVCCMVCKDGGLVCILVSQSLDAYEVSAGPQKGESVITSCRFLMCV